MSKFKKSAIERLPRTIIGACAGFLVSAFIYGTVAPQLADRHLLISLGLGTIIGAALANERNT